VTVPVSSSTSFSLTRRALSFMKRHPNFSDATKLSAILREFFDASRREVTTELAMQRFVAVGQTGVADASSAGRGTKKRTRRGQDDDPPSTEKVAGPASATPTRAAERCLIALSELQRLGSIRLTGTGHQVRNLMVSWSGGTGGD
jgi:hypothetical protein